MIRVPIGDGVDRPVPGVKVLVGKREIKALLQRRDAVLAGAAAATAGR